MTTSSFLHHVLRVAGIAIAASVLAAGSALLPAVPLQASTSAAADPAAPAPPAADAGVIAYVQRSTGDIHLISPDGTNDRVLWTNPDPDHTPISLAWRRDGRELAFSSQHEWQCSIYDGDVYAIRSDGTGYRRITNAPACAELAGLPKGSVTVFVEDVYGDSFVYVAGAPGLKRAQLGTMTFDNVADFGPGVFQPAVGIALLDRAPGREPYADVLPGQTVQGGSLYIADTTSIRGWGAGKVSWKADGAMLGYNMRTCSGIDAIAAVPTYGSVGNALPVIPKARSCLHSWNPTLAGSNQYLYYSTDWFSDDAHGIFVNTVGNASGGTRLYHPPPLVFQILNDIEWLPDGSGFLFSLGYMSGWDPVYTCAGHDYHSCSNIFEYDLATHRITQRTDIDDKSVNRMAVSPDGQHIVFERTTDPVFDPTSSLWIINRDGTGLHKLLDDAGRPAWGKVAAPPPPTATPTATATRYADRHPHGHRHPAVWPNRHPHVHRHAHCGREVRLPAAGAEELRGSAADEHAHQHTCRDRDRHADTHAHQHSDRDGNRHASERRHPWPRDLQGSGRTGHRAAVAILRWVEDDHRRDDHHRWRGALSLHVSRKPGLRTGVLGALPVPRQSFVCHKVADCQYHRVYERQHRAWRRLRYRRCHPAVAAGRCSTSPAGHLHLATARHHRRYLSRCVFRFGHGRLLVYRGSRERRQLHRNRPVAGCGLRQRIWLGCLGVQWPRLIRAVVLLS